MSYIAGGILPKPRRTPTLYRVIARFRNDNHTQPTFFGLPTIDKDDARTQRDSLRSSSLRRWPDAQLARIDNQHHSQKSAFDKHTILEELTP